MSQRVSIKDLPAGNQHQALINETDCTLTIDGRTHSGHGAYVTPQIAVVYVSRTDHPLVVAITDWHGSILGHGRITGEWRQQNPRQRYRMASVQFKITDNNTWYRGRLSMDSGDLIKGRRMRDQRNKS